MVDLRFHAYAGPQTISDLLALAEHPSNDAAEDNGILIHGANEIGLAGKGDIVLLAKKSYAAELEGCAASVVVTSSALVDLVPDGILCIVAENPQALFTKILELLYPNAIRHIALTSLWNNDAPTFEDDVAVGSGAVIGANVEIGSGSIIGPNSVIGAGVTIGRDTIVGANVSIECAHIGDHVIIHAGARIGTQGFGWLDHGKTNTKIPQLGRVIIQDHVEVGTNSTIDRGALGDTSIGEGTKIDNLVQIGHNCRIGRNCLIAASTGLSGSTIVGDSVLMGGGVGTSGHLSIGENSVIHGRAAVTKDWPAGSMLAGAPAQDIKGFWRELAVLRRLVKGDKR